MFEDHIITVVGPLLQAKTTCHYLQGGPRDSATLFTAGEAMKFVPLLGKTLTDTFLRGGSEYPCKDFSITVGILRREANHCGGGRSPGSIPRYQAFLKLQPVNRPRLIN